jgi:tetratricopeptide (TPR) repeat protein
MRLSKSRICAIAILVLFVGAGAGCSLIGKVRATNELNEAAKAYKEGHFEDAEQHARKALAFDPDNRTATIFVARIVHQQYKPGVDSPDNIQKARDAIEAYKRVLQIVKKRSRRFHIFTRRSRMTITCGSGFRRGRMMRMKPMKNEPTPMRFSLARIGTAPTKLLSFLR